MSALREVAVPTPFRQSRFEEGLDLGKLLGEPRQPISPRRGDRAQAGNQRAKISLVAAMGELAQPAERECLEPVIPGSLLDEPGRCGAGRRVVFQQSRLEVGG